VENKEVNRKLTLAKAYRHFAPFVKPYRGLVAGFLAASFLGLGANLFQANLLQKLIDAALERNSGPLGSYALLYGLAILAHLFATFAIASLYGGFSARYLHDFRLNAIDHIQKIPQSAMEKRHSGDFISRLTNDLSAVQDFMGGTLLDAFSNLAMLLAASAYMIYLNWRLLAVSIFVVPVALVAVNLMMKPMYGYFRKAGDAVGRANAAAQDALGGILTVKAYAMEAAIARMYGVNIDQAMDYDIKADKIMRWTPPFNILMRAMPTVLCIGYGSYLILRGELSPGELIAFNYLLGFVQWPLAFLPDMFTRIKRALGSGERVAEVLEIPAERSDGEDFSAAAIGHGGEALRFEGVSFAYGDGADAIADLSFSLRAGEKIALVGASGCGKSTVLKLLCGTYETHRGSIGVFGRDTRAWSLPALRSQFSVIAQDIFLFPLSVGENIALGRVGASEPELLEASEIANASEFIPRLPEGYRTQVGERGVRLSGGQKQRVALARAILKRAPILLLDEPTSALDTHSEALVQEAIERSLAGRTAIIVAHRLSTIKKVDRILVMDKGSLAEQGSHEELMAKDGLYARLYLRQFNSAEMPEAAEADHG
jgi:subfamily B ATP-binding cassette protein MsbA/ATP-binding cassette subfamily B protein AbcA/BmrA